MSVLPATMKAVGFTGLRRVELVERACDASPLKPDEVAGRTLATLVSPGTEVNYLFDKEHAEVAFGGYASVCEIDAVGEEVKDIKAGQRVFSLGNHSARQRHARRNVFVVPEGVSPADAVHARIMGVSWTTLTTTRARPAARVLILGLGIVGNLAAQLFAASGYEVVAVDPVESRREIARRCGLTDVRAKCPVEDPAFAGTVALGVDCSGHEQAVLDAIKVVRKGGEVVLVGVPWKKRAEVTGFDVMHAVFHRYVTLRSGWEWELPFHRQEFAVSSLAENWNGALAWIASGRVKLQGLTESASPREAQRVYEELAAQRGKCLSSVFDWTKA